MIIYFLKNSEIVVYFHGNEIIRLKFVKDFALSDFILCQLSHSKTKVRILGPEYLSSVALLTKEYVTEYCEGAGISYWE